MADNMVIGWEDEIEESSSFELIPDGDYWFEVTNFEREWWEPNDPENSRIKACNQANIELTIIWKNDQGQVKTSKIQYRLKVTESLTFLIFRFFECVGLRKKGDGTKLKLALFNQVVGRTGVCAIGKREGSKGGTFNDVKYCYPPEEAPKITKNENPAAASPIFTI